MEITALYEKPVVQKENWIIRNLQITQSYHELTLWMRHVIGPENMSWVAFATFASKTAGHCIRHEQLPDAFNDLLARLAHKGGPKALAHQYLANPAARQNEARHGLLASIYLRISRSVSYGNCVVYDELAPLFREFVDCFQDDLRPNDAKLDRFLALLQPGPTHAGGQAPLREAFSNYYHARFDLKAKRKAEKILLANMLIGLHEQMRLQPMIEDAMAAPVLEWVDDLPDWFARLLDALPFGQQTLTAVLKDWFTSQLTETVMSISTPGLPMRLGQNVVSPTPQTRFPRVLQTIESPRVRELLTQFNNSDNTLTGSAADNWARLDDRMGFIVDLFRSHQQNPALFTPPFTPDQQTAIRAGLVPDGAL